MGLWIAALSRGMAPKEKPAKGKIEEELEKSQTDTKLIPKIDKKTYIICGVLLLLCTIVIVLMFLKYSRLKRDREPLEEPFVQLRSSLATAIGDPELLDSGYKKVAEEMKSVPVKTDEAEKFLNEGKRQYRVIFNKNTRGSSRPWKFFGNGLYYFSKGEKSWYDAENFCISRGAHLASILNDKEQDFIKSELQEASWIGLMNENMDGKWRWSDGSKVVTQYWSEGQPRNTELFVESNQDCAFMVPSPTKNNWNDDNCHRPYRWVCKENLDLREL